MTAPVTVSRARTDTIRIRISPDRPPPSEGAVDERWAEMTKANSRLFDGPILGVKKLDLDSGIVECRRDGYKRLAVQPEVPTGVDLLSVSGVITALDRQGVPHILLGRRGPKTRIYGGMWELAPSGGVEPPAPDRDEVSWADLIAHLQSELLSETGLRETIKDAHFLAAIRDPAAFSTDLVIQGRLAPTIDQLPLARSNWEYSESRWLPLSDLPAFASAEPVIATTSATIPLLAPR